MNFFNQQLQFLIKVNLKCTYFYIISAARFLGKNIRALFYLFSKQMSYYKSLCPLTQLKTTKLKTNIGICFPQTTTNGNEFVIKITVLNKLFCNRYFEIWTGKTFYENKKKNGLEMLYKTFRLILSFVLAKYI